MSEPKKTVALPSALPGATAAAPVNAPVAAAKPNADAMAPSAPVAAPKVSSVPLFGGHKGGGKKRLDGLVAGSPEAIAADKEKNAARMREARAREKNSSLPSPLPSVATAPENAAAPLAVDSTALSGAVVDLAGVAAVAPAPLFVPWTEKVLARPIKLLTRIIDRVRCSALMKRVKKLMLEPAQEKEIEKDIQFKEAALNDFNVSLANCAQVELNKRRVPGAEHSHWLDVFICGGELVSCHMDVVDKIEKMILENEIKKKQAHDIASEKLN